MQKILLDGKKLNRLFLWEKVTHMSTWLLPFDFFHLQLFKLKKVWVSITTLNNEILEVASD